MQIYQDAPNADPSTVTLSNNPASGAMSAGKLSGTLSGLGIKCVFCCLVLQVHALIVSELTQRGNFPQHRHGDLLFITYKDKETATISSTSASEIQEKANGVPAGADPSTSKRSQVNKPWETVVEDPVDQYWEAKDGLIQRKRDRMCRHGDKSMCDHCMPLEVCLFGTPLIVIPDSNAHIRSRMTQNTSKNTVLSIYHSTPTFAS
jgi:nuclear protein localization family protein 4